MILLAVKEGMVKLLHVDLDGHEIHSAGTHSKCKILEGSLKTNQMSGPCRTRLHTGHPPLFTFHLGKSMAEAKNSRSPCKAMHLWTHSSKLWKRGAVCHPHCCQVGWVAQIHWKKDSVFTQVILLKTKTSNPIKQTQRQKNPKLYSKQMWRHPPNKDTSLLRASPAN